MPVDPWEMLQIGPLSPFKISKNLKKKKRKKCCNSFRSVWKKEYKSFYIWGGFLALLIFQLFFFSQWSLCVNLKRTTKISQQSSANVTLITCRKSICLMSLAHACVPPLRSEKKKKKRGLRSAGSGGDENRDGDGGNWEKVTKRE